MLRRPHPLLCYLLAFAQAFWVVGCSDQISSGGGSGPSSTLAGVLAQRDLGSVVFDLYRASVAGEPAGPDRDARLAALDARQTPFVDAVNHIANADTLSGASQTTAALFRLVDDDTLPVLAEHIARTLETLAGDAQALNAVLDLISSKNPGAIPLEDLIELLGRMVNYPDTEHLWQALAQLIRENDGVDDLGLINGEPRLVGDLLAFISDSLRQVSSAPPSSSVSQAMDDILATLSEEATIRGTFDFGAPEWVARLDDRGVPRVVADASGRLHPPFVDLDSDGLADVDSDGAFVDVSGRPIDRPTFGAPGSLGYDAAGRALTPGGQLLYEYLDAKATVLALVMQLSGELLDRDLHGKGRRVIEAGLGPQINGVYDRANPVFELQWGLLELLEPDVAPKMLRALAELLRSDPALAERIMVTLSRALDASRQAGQQSSFAASRISDPRVIQLTDDLLPLADDIFEQPASGSVSTARQLMDTLATLRTRAPNFPAQLAPLVLFHSVERETTPDGDRNDIDELRSWPVDPTQPAWVGGTDNRSALHQLLDLLARADGCSFFGNNLAVMILNMMADQSPATVSNLVSLLNALPGFLPNLFCSGISQDLASLDALARSGALDALLPLAKTFKDRGETPLLVRLLVRLQNDYDATIRPIEPDLALFLDSGALESLVEVIDVSRTIIDPVSGESVADIQAEALAKLVDDDAVVLNPRGLQTRSLAYLLLDPLRDLDRRVVAAGVTQDMSDIADGLFEVFLERVTVGGVEQLRNGSLIPLAETSVDIFARALPADAATRKQDVDQAQADLLDFGASRDFATLVDTLRVIDSSATRATINRSLVNMLTPNRVVANDIFGAVARISVLALQAPPASGTLQDLAPFLAQVTDPGNPLVPDSLRAFERLLTADQGQTVLNVLRAALNTDPLTGEPPALTVIEIVQDVDAAAATAIGQPYDPGALRADLLDTVTFIRDGQDGLAWIFDLIRGRQIR